MEVTSVRIHKIEREGYRMKGIASITIDNALAIHDIRIIEGNNGLYIAMPSRRTPVGYKDLVHPINQEIRATFEKAILDAYEKEDVYTPFDEE